MRAQPPLPGQVDQRTCQEELFPRQSANQPAAGCKRQLQIVRIICTCNRTHYVHYMQWEWEKYVPHLVSRLGFQTHSSISQSQPAWLLFNLHKWLSTMCMCGSSSAPAWGWRWLTIWQFPMAVVGTCASGVVRVSNANRKQQMILSSHLQALALSVLTYLTFTSLQNPHELALS